MSLRSRNERAPARAESRKEPEPQLTDEQWKLIADLFPEPAPSAQGGRPRRAARECVEGILWVLRSGARWKDLPPHSGERMCMIVDVQPRLIHELGEQHS